VIDKTGFSSLNSADRCPVSPPENGISEALMQELKSLWSRVYGRLLSDDEILEIYRNVKHLAETLAQEMTL